MAIYKNLDGTTKDTFSIGKGNPVGFRTNEGITEYHNNDGQYRRVDFSPLVSEPTGFPNRTDSVISFNDSSLEFTIAPSGVIRSPSFPIEIPCFRSWGISTSTSGFFATRVPLSPALRSRSSGRFVPSSSGDRSGTVDVVRPGWPGFGLVRWKRAEAGITRHRRGNLNDGV